MRYTRFLALSTFVILTAFIANTGYASGDGSEPELTFKQGHVPLGNGIAALNVPASFGYLDPAQARRVIVELWGNPSDEADTLGMIVPTGLKLTDTESWAVIFKYTDDGHISDDDAKSINYSDLLRDMKAGLKDENEERRRAGYPGIELVDWAEPPHYDQTSHKLYWAKNLKFDGSPENTLNYNIRALGRQGVLELNVVANMAQLADINKHLPEILAMVDFSQGQRYTDFNPKADKLAVYGIGALIAGKIAAKAGLFKLMIGALIALKKVVILALVAVGGFLRKVLGRKSTSAAGTGTS